MPEPRISRKRKAVNYTESLELDDASATTTAKGKSKRKSKFAEDEESDDFMEELPKNRKSSQEGSSQECKGGRRSKPNVENKPTNTRAALSLAERREKAELQQAIELSKKSTKTARATHVAEGGRKTPLDGGSLSDSEPSLTEQKQIRALGANHDTNVEMENNEAKNEDTQGKATEAPETQRIVDEHASVSAAESGPDSARDTAPTTDTAPSRKEKENCVPQSAVKKTAKQHVGSDDDSAYDENSEHLDGDDTSSDESAFEPEEHFQPPAKFKAKAMVKEVTLNPKPKPKSIPPKKTLVKTTKTAPPTKPAVQSSKSAPPCRTSRSSDTYLGGLGMLKGSATYRVGLSKRHKSAAPLHPYLKGK